MAELGWNRYGKANVRFLRVVKDSKKHEPHVSCFSVKRSLGVF